MWPRVQRSSLIFPVNVPRFVERAWTRNADYLTLDLEDAVPPAQKAAARPLVKEAIAVAARGGSDVSVRINHETPLEDCEASVWPGLRAIHYPKTESREEIVELDRIITRLEQERGIPEGTVEIVAMMETVHGVWNAAEIAGASPRIKHFGGFAAGDGSTSLGVTIEDQRFVNVLGWGEGETDLAGRSQGKTVTGAPRWEPGAPVFSVSEGVDQQLRETDRMAWRRGGRSAGGIHPSVVEPANQSFTPSAEDVLGAEEIAAAYRQAYETGQGFGVYRGRVIDAAVAGRAQELIEYARACAERDREKAEAQERMRKEQGDAR